MRFNNIRWRRIIPRYNRNLNTFILWFNDVFRKNCEKPVFAFGQGFGSITTKEGISYTKQLLQYCTIATFRDEESLKEFKKFAPNVPVYYTADPAFAYEQGNPEKGKKNLE